jgi:hypothetical protein
MLTCRSGPYLVYFLQSSHLQWPSLARPLQHLAVYITGHLCSHLPAGGVSSLGLWAVSFFHKDHRSHSLIFDWKRFKHRGQHCQRCICGLGMRAADYGCCQHRVWSSVYSDDSPDIVGRFDISNVKMLTQVSSE